MAIDKPPVTPENDEMIGGLARDMEKKSLLLPPERTLVPASLQAALPELPEARAQEIYERMMMLERELASPTGSLDSYTFGTASKPNEMWVAEGTDLLLSAEHATAQQRAGKYKEPDTGTAALVAISHEDFGTRGVIMLGRQIGDANDDPEHPLKQFVTDQINARQVGRFASIHGMNGGKFFVRRDGSYEGPYDVLLGVGSNPSEATLAVARQVKEVVGDMGFTVGINQPFIQVDDGVPARMKSDQAQYAYNNFKADGANTTRKTAEEAARASDVELSAIQAELSDLVRIRDHDRERRRNADGTPDMRLIIDGVYAGYQIMHAISEIHYGEQQAA